MFYLVKLQTKNDFHFKGNEYDDINETSNFNSTTDDWENTPPGNIG